MTKRWQISPPDPAAARQLAEALRVSPALGQILLNRRLSDISEARAFLRPDLRALRKPQDLPDLVPAIDRIDAALRKNEKIVVYGDYDVDGITGTAILIRFFRALGRSVDYYIPHRMTEGYSLSLPAIEKFGQEGVRCMITVDCGTSDAAKVARARELGIEVVIVDHHEPPADLPKDAAIVNPKVREERGHDASLSAAGVAFKLAWALADRLSPDGKKSPLISQFLMDSLGLVAIGAIADVVPLVGENRILTSFGLAALRKTTNPGLKALLDSVRLGENEIEASDIAFRVAPRLNAAGRLGSAKTAVDLLISEDPVQIAKLVAELDKTNTLRQKIEAEITARAKELVEQQHDLRRDHVIVLAEEEWHQGVVGIVAARLVDHFHRPAIVIAMDGEKGKGSGRSIKNFNLYNALCHCREQLITFGGHEHAAGVQIARRQVAALRERINDYAREHLKAHDMEAVLPIDCELPLHYVSREFLGEIELLAPHGQANPKPLVASSNLTLVGEPRIVGKRGDHLQFRVTQNGTARKAVAFGQAGAFETLRAAREGQLSLAYTPMLNRWQGMESVELEVKDIRVQQGAP